MQHLDERIITFLDDRGWMTCGEIARSLGVKPDVIDARLEELRLADHVEFQPRDGRIRWRLIESEAHRGEGVGPRALHQLSEQY